MTTIYNTIRRFALNPSIVFEDGGRAGEKIRRGEWFAELTRLVKHHTTGCSYIVFYKSQIYCAQMQFDLDIDIELLSLSYLLLCEFSRVTLH